MVRQVQSEPRIPKGAEVTQGPVAIQTVDDIHSMAPFGEQVTQGLYEDGIAAE